MSPLQAAMREACREWAAGQVPKVGGHVDPDPSGPVAAASSWVFCVFVFVLKNHSCAPSPCKKGPKINTGSGTPNAAGPTGMGSGRWWPKRSWGQAWPVASVDGEGEDEVGPGPLG